jgi:hypothetical protein
MQRRLVLAVTISAGVHLAVLVTLLAWSARPVRPSVLRVRVLPSGGATAELRSAPASSPAPASVAPPAVAPRCPLGTASPARSRSSTSEPRSGNTCALLGRSVDSTPGSRAGPDGHTAGFPFVVGTRPTRRHWPRPSDSRSERHLGADPHCRRFSCPGSGGCADDDRGHRPAGWEGRWGAGEEWRRRRQPRRISGRPPLSPGRTGAPAGPVCGPLHALRGCPGRMVQGQRLGRPGAFLSRCFRPTNRRWAAGKHRLGPARPGRARVRRAGGGSAAASSRLLHRRGAVPRSRVNPPPRPQGFKTGLVEMTPLLPTVAPPGVQTCF